MKKRMLSVLFIMILVFFQMPMVAKAEDINTIDYSNSIYQMTVDHIVTTVTGTEGNVTKMTSGSVRNVGTVFYIDNNLFVTAAHVVVRDKSAAKYGTISIVYSEDNAVVVRNVNLKVAYVDNVNDIAILYGTDLTKKYCEPLNVKTDDIDDGIDDTLDIGESVSICGFPGTSKMNTTVGKFILVCDINAADSSGVSSYIEDTIVIETVVKPGTSGGPVLDSDNNVVGLVCASSSVYSYAIQVKFLIDDISKLEQVEE